LPASLEHSLPIFGLSERSLGCLVPPQTTAGQQLSWTLRGEQRNDGIWFNLQLPPCSLTTLDVILPFPERLDCPSARSFLSGPFPIPNSVDRLWKLQLGNSLGNDLQLVVRSPPPSPSWQGGEK